MKLNLICGYQVNLIHKSIKYVSRKEVFIPYEGKVKASIKVGESFDKGHMFFQVQKRKLLSSYYLPDDLGIKVGKTLDHVTRIEGEYISKDDVIAERLVSGGLLSKRVVSEHDGIINLSKASLGYVNVLSELGVETVVSTFGGVVQEINVGGGIVVQTDVFEVPLFYSNPKFQENIFGDFKVLSDPMSIPSTRKIGDSLEGKIIFAGRFLHPKFAMELFKRGCKFILVSSMNYDDFKNLDVPIGVLTGFGNIYFDTTKLEFLREREKSQAVVSLDTNTIQFPVGLNDKISQIFEQNYYTVSFKKGDIVRSVELESFGLVGEIVSLDEKCKIMTQEGGYISVDLENLELYEEEFSLMRTRIF